jgi:hypothetical protein
MVFRLKEQGGFDFLVEADSEAQIRRIFSSLHYDVVEAESADGDVYDLEDAKELFG